MKPVVLFLAAIFFVGSLSAQNAKKSDEVVKFKELTYDFGKIKRGVPVTHEFTFANIGTTPLIIETANASCGCTTPTWPKAPVMKGKSNKIIAGFNAASPGPFNKSIYVKIAGVDTPVELKITGEVVAE